MARLDTGWHAHPKVLALGLQAMGLHAWSISYCDDALSDGFIPMGAWPALPGAGAAVKALLVAGLWERVEDGFRLHDYLDYNRSRAQVDAYMAAKIEAGRAGGLAKAANKRVADAKADALANGVAPALAKSQQDLYQKATPGPGPGFNSRPPARLAPRTARARARGDDGFQPLASLLSADLPDDARAEILERLERPPLGQPAVPAKPEIFEKTETNHALG